MLGIVRLYHDSYGNNMGSRTFCQLSRYFGGVLITDNKKIKDLDFKQITHQEALLNRKKFTKLLVYNTKPNMFGGLAPKHTPEVVELIMSVPDVYFYNCDPILDLQLSVPNSHEHSVPGLTRAVNKLINFATRLDRRNTDLTKFLAAQINIEDVGNPDKKWLGCYFGNARNKFRQEQVYQLLNELPSRLIIGHEHEHFPWFDYTPSFYKTLSTAWTTPIIGDQKLHYETGIPSVRLYEVWHSTAIGLIDVRLREPMLSERFYFSTPEEYRAKTVEIANNPELYLSMLKEQKQALKKLKAKYIDASFDWKKVLQKKQQVIDNRKKAIKDAKAAKVSAAKERLRKSTNLKIK